MVDWRTPKPQINFDEAKRWIRPAERDYDTVSTLTSHEVAEKLLKVGMYTTCDVHHALYY